MNDSVNTNSNMKPPTTDELVSLAEKFRGIVRDTDRYPICLSPAAYAAIVKECQKIPNQPAPSDVFGVRVVESSALPFIDKDGNEVHGVSFEDRLCFDVEAHMPISFMMPVLIPKRLIGDINLGGAANR